MWFCVPHALSPAGEGYERSGNRGLGPEECPRPMIFNPEPLVDLTALKFCISDLNLLFFLQCEQPKSTGNQICQATFQTTHKSVPWTATLYLADID